MAKKTKRTAEPIANPATLVQPHNVVFEYIKSPLFRVIHVDGAIGGLTPAGNLHIAFYNERSAIPRMMVHPMNEYGTLGAPIPEQTVVRPGVIREMDVDIVMTPKAVDNLIQWLTDRKADLEKAIEFSRQVEIAQHSTGRKKH